tara:strand:- start:14759 stop:18352 length:3594 start_codon:yes stop_codon:yes gene_type:complete
MVLDKITFKSKIDLDTFRQYFIFDNFGDKDFIELLLNEDLTKSISGTTEYDRYYMRFFNASNIIYYYDINGTKTNGIKDNTYDIDLSLIASQNAIKYMSYLDLLSGFNHNLGLIINSTSAEDTGNGIIDEISLINHEFSIPINYMKRDGSLFSNQNIPDICNDISLKFKLNTINLDFTGKKIYDFFTEGTAKLEKTNSYCDYDIDKIKNLFSNFEFNNYFDINQYANYYHFETYKYEFKFLKSILNYNILLSYYNTIDSLDNSVYKSIKLDQINKLLKKFRKVFYNFNTKLINIKNIINSIDSIPELTKKEQLEEGRSILSNIKDLNDKIEDNSDNLENISKYHKSREDINKQNKNLIYLSIFILIFTIFIYIFNDQLYENRKTKVFISIICLALLVSLNYFIFDKKIYEKFQDDVSDSQENITFSPDFEEARGDFDTTIGSQNVQNAQLSDQEIAEWISFKSDLDANIGNDVLTSRTFANPLKWTEYSTVDQNDIKIVRMRDADNNNLISKLQDKLINSEALELTSDEFLAIREDSDITMGTDPDISTSYYRDITEYGSDTQLKYILPNHYIELYDKYYKANTFNFNSRPALGDESKHFIEEDYQKVDFTELVANLENLGTDVKISDLTPYFQQIQDKEDIISELESDVNKIIRDYKALETEVGNLQDIATSFRETITYLETKSREFDGYLIRLERYRDEYLSKISSLENEKEELEGIYQNLERIIDEQIRPIVVLLQTENNSFSDDNTEVLANINAAISAISANTQRLTEENSKLQIRIEGERGNQSLLRQKLLDVSKELTSVLIEQQRLKDEREYGTDQESLQLKFYKEKADKLIEEITKEKTYFERTFKELKKKYEILAEKNTNLALELNNIRNKNTYPIEIRLKFAFSNNVIKYLDFNKDTTNFDENKKIFIDEIKLDFTELFEKSGKKIYLDRLNINYNNLIIDDGDNPLLDIKIYSSYKLEEVSAEDIVSAIHFELENKENFDDLIYLKYVDNLQLKYEKNLYTFTNPKLKKSENPLETQSIYITKNVEYTPQDYNADNIRQQRYDNDQIISNVYTLISDIKGIEISKNSYYKEINPHLKIENDSIQKTYDNINKTHNLDKSKLNLIEMDTIDYNNLNKLLIYISMIFIIIIILNNIFDNSIIFTIILIISVFVLIFLYFKNKLKLVRTKWRNKYWGLPKDKLEDINILE